jgi:chromate reductase
VTRKVAQAIADRAPKHLSFKFVDISGLSMFNQDDEPNPPQSWVDFRNEIRSADAVLFATPEYNRSVPGVLKNAIDIGSRPYGHSVFNGKPAAVVSVSPGAIGGFGANHHLRQTLVFLNMPVLNQPEAYVGNAFSLFEEGGDLANEATGEFLATIAKAFADLIETNLG